MSAQNVDQAKKESKESLKKTSTEGDNKCPQVSNLCTACTLLRCESGSVSATCYSCTLNPKCCWLSKTTEPDCLSSSLSPKCPPSLYTPKGDLAALCEPNSSLSKYEKLLASLRDRKCSISPNSAFIYRSASSSLCVSKCLPSSSTPASPAVCRALRYSSCFSPDRSPQCSPKCPLPLMCSPKCIPESMCSPKCLQEPVCCPQPLECCPKPAPPCALDVLPRFPRCCDVVNCSRPPEVCQTPCCPPQCPPQCPPLWPPQCPPQCSPQSPPPCPQYCCPPACPPQCSPQCPPACPPQCSPQCSPQRPPWFPPQCPPKCQPRSPPSCPQYRCPPQSSPPCPPLCPQPCYQTQCPKPCCPPQLSPKCLPQSSPQCPQPCCPAPCKISPCDAPCEMPNNHLCCQEVVECCPKGFQEFFSGTATWDTFGVRIKWTDPPAPGCATVWKDYSVLYKICIEVKESCGLQPDMIMANCWTHMKTLCNPCGTWKNIPMLFQCDSSSLGEFGIHRYVYTVSLTPMVDDTSKLTFNIAWRDILIWANNTLENCI